MLAKLRGAQDQLRRSRQNFVSLVDADARLMRRAHGGTVDRLQRPGRCSADARRRGGQPGPAGRPRSASSRPTTANCPEWSMRPPQRASKPS